LSPAVSPCLPPSGFLTAFSRPSASEFQLSGQVLVYRSQPLTSTVPLSTIHGHIRGTARRSFRQPRLFRDFFSPVAMHVSHSWTQVHVPMWVQRSRYPWPDAPYSFARRPCSELVFENLSRPVSPNSFLFSPSP